MASPEPSWIVCQLGAREHYAVARALHRRGALERLVTDAWITPGNALGALRRGLRERYHAGLAATPVSAASLSLIAFEMRAKAQKLGGWHRVMARNGWFQRMTVRALADLPAGPRTVFAYSYAALDILRFARSKGWRTVLGQIDPGPPEERIVASLYEARPELRGQWQPVPREYWQRWREECALADYIVVNSGWSASALIEEGVAAEKIRIVPLAYEFPPGAAAFRREYPDRFTAKRPMRALFLGQINLRKGVGALFEAIRMLEAEPVEFWLAGPMQIPVPEDIERNPRVKFFGQVARGDTARLYRDADVFLFPTFSDGFGLTQLEAQAWRLPVIASQFCGDVVEDGRNGIVLGEVTRDAIATALKACVADPSRLALMAAVAVAAEEYSLNRAGSRLVAAAGMEPDSGQENAAA